MATVIDLCPQGKEKEFFDDLQTMTGLYPPGVRQPADVDVRVNASKRVTKAINAFLQRPVKVARKMAMKGFGVSSDLPVQITNAMPVALETANYDMRFEMAFRMVQIEADRDFWETVTGTHSVSFRKIPEGEKVEVYGRAAGLVTNYVSKYGAGIGWTDEMVRFRKTQQIMDTAEAFRAAFYLDKANNHYYLLNQAANANTVAERLTSFDTTGANDLEKLINTVNSANFSVRNNLKDKGYGDTTMAETCLFASPKHKARLERAFGELSQAFSGSTSRLQWNTRIEYTFNTNAYKDADDTFGLLVYPGYKNEMAEAMPLTTYNDFDPLSLSYIQTAFSYYGAAVNQPLQVRYVALEG